MLGDLSQLGIKELALMRALILYRHGIPVCPDAFDRMEIDQIEGEIERRAVVAEMAEAAAR
jgi:hypothetical protein